MIRGLFTHAGVLYGVAGATLLRLDSAGVRTTLGTLNSSGGPLDFASMLAQLCITDGSYLYVWDGASLRTSPGYPGGERIAFIDQRIAFDIRATQRFGWTALGEALSIGALDFASAESAPDNLRAVLAVAGDLWLFGEYTTEPWRSVGGEQVFASTGNTLEYGCAAPHAVRKAANSVTWLARDERGQALVLTAAGYQAQRISTRPIEERFEGRALEQASAYSWSDGGSALYCLNVPGVDTTLVYDHTFKQWHERAELVNGDWAQWRARCHAFAYGRHYFGAADGTIYVADKNVHRFGGDPKCRARVAPVLSHPSMRRVFFPHFELLCERATTGTVMLRWSDDNGATWGAWHTRSAGAMGEHRQRIRWERCGSGRDRVYEVRMSDNAPFHPVAAEVGIV